MNGKEVDDLPRVMMVVPYFPTPVTGGLERQSHVLSKALVDCGVSVQVLAVRFNASHLAYDIRDEIVIHRIPWSKSKTLRAFQSAIGVAKILTKFRNTYDIVHVHQHSGFGLFALLVCAFLRKPTLIKVPNVAMHGIAAMSNEPLGFLRVALFRLAEAAVAICPQSISELMCIGFARNRVLAVPNGIAVSSGDPLPDRQKTDASTHKSQTNPCRVVFVGRLDVQKRLEDLLRAWSSVWQEMPDAATLEIWGEGPLERSLKLQCRRLAIDSSVRFAGHVHDVRERLHEMDVFVLPSEAEGNSNAMLEAMAAGLPILGTRVGGAEMMVGKEGLPYLVAPGDVDGLARNLKQLVSNSHLRQELGERMRGRIENIFDIRNISKVYLEAYRRLVAGRADSVGFLSSAVVSEYLGP
ncbi:MAG: glycosyltransferase family 4 protein [Pirellulaceae bacterium]